MIVNFISTLKGFRDNVGIAFEHWFNLAVKLGEEINTVPSVPRLAKIWSRFRPNIENDGPLSYFKKDMAILFLYDLSFQLEYFLKDRIKNKFLQSYHL